MKYALLMMAFLGLWACKQADQQDDGKIEQKDLKKLSWLMGDWTADFRGQPFYERFTTIDDTTMQYVTYVFMGTDSSVTSTHKMVWSDSTYFLGEGLNYRVITLNDKIVKFVPHLQSMNDIIWEYVDDQSWTATLATATDTLVYNMKRFDALDSVIAATPARKPAQ